MKWTPGGDSPDVEDRRDETGGGGGGFQFGGMHIGIGGAIVLLILSFIFKTNFFALLSGGGSVAPSPSAVSDPNTPRGSSARDQAEKPLVQFVSFVLDDTQKTWTNILPQQANKPYRHAKLVLVSRRHSIRLRWRGIGHWPVLLSARRKSLYRPRFLR